MGNRLSIGVKGAKKSIYMQWQGGRGSQLAFLDEAFKRYYESFAMNHSPDTFIDTLYWTISNYMSDGNVSPLTLYLHNKLIRTDQDNCHIEIDMPHDTAMDCRRTPDSTSLVDALPQIKINSFTYEQLRESVLAGKDRKEDTTANYEYKNYVGISDYYKELEIAQRFLNTSNFILPEYMRPYQTEFVELLKKIRLEGVAEAEAKVNSAKILEV